METKCRISDVSFTVEGKQRITFTLDEKRDVSALLDKDLRMKAVEWKEKRSLDANGLLWHCLDEIARTIREDKWKVYLMMLRRYGVFTYGVFKKNAVEHLKAMYRACEEVSTVNVNGQEGVQMLIYFGSSTYNTKEFSRLLDGVISEMEEMGLETPAQEETERLIREWKA